MEKQLSTVINHDFHEFIANLNYRIEHLGHYKLFFMDIVHYPIENVYVAYIIHQKKE